MMAWQPGGGLSSPVAPATMSPKLLSNEEKSMTKTVLFYAHCATAPQHEVSIETQIELGKEFIRKQGWKLVDVFTDHMGGGTTHKTRPGLRALLKRASEGEIDVVVCISMDRLSRDVARSSEIYKELLDHGVELQTMAGDTPVTDPGSAIRALLDREMEEQSRYLVRLEEIDDRQSAAQ